MAYLSTYLATFYINCALRLATTMLKISNKERELSFLFQEEISQFKTLLLKANTQKQHKSILHSNVTSEFLGLLKRRDTLAMRRVTQSQRLQLPLGQQTHKVAVCARQLLLDQLAVHDHSAIVGVLAEQNDAQPVPANKLFFSVIIDSCKMHPWSSMTAAFIGFK